MRKRFWIFALLLTIGFGSACYLCDVKPLSPNIRHLLEMLSGSLVAISYYFGSGRSNEKS